MKSFPNKLKRKLFNTSSLPLDSLLLSWYSGSATATTPSGSGFSGDVVAWLDTSKKLSAALLITLQLNYILLHQISESVGFQLIVQADINLLIKELFRVVRHSIPSNPTRPTFMISIPFLWGPHQNNATNMLK